MIQVDESKLNWVDRLGLAWCRLNCYEWDDIIGPKPESYDDLPIIAPKVKFRQWKKPCKYDYTSPAIMAIESIIGEVNTSRCWWIFELGKTEEEWLRWYVTECFKCVPEAALVNQWQN